MVQLVLKCLKYLSVISKAASCLRHIAQNLTFYKMG